jgi:hypothetical protein
VEKGFFADKAILILILTAIIAFAAAPLILGGVVTITATVGNYVPQVRQIRICNGTCAVTKASLIAAGDFFTIEVNATDPNGIADINTQSFRITMFHGGVDTNTCGGTEDWDCNILYLARKDDNIKLATANGCTQTYDNNSIIYCINIPANAWTLKFLNGDVNLYVAVDDNAGGYDMNAVDKNAFTIAKTFSTTEDVPSGTYSGNPNTLNNAFVSSLANAYVQSTHNGNADINVTVRASDLNVSSSIYIWDDNESWKRDSSAPTTSETFNHAFDANVRTDWNRGTYSTSAVTRIFYWLDIPAFQPSGSYTGTLTYGSAASD